jgi:hypothetical protein
MCCVLSCSVNQPTTISLSDCSLPVSSVRYPAMPVTPAPPHRCPCACQLPVNVGLALPFVVHLSMSVCASAFRLRICPCLAPCLSSTRTSISALVLSSAPLSFSAPQPFVYAYVHVSRPAFSPRVRQCLAPLPFVYAYVCYCSLSSSDVARRRLLMLSVPLIRTAANPQSR